MSTGAMVRALSDVVEESHVSLPQKIREAWNAHAHLIVRSEGDRTTVARYRLDVAGGQRDSVAAMMRDVGRDLERIDWDDVQQATVEFSPLGANGFGISMCLEANRITAMFGPNQFEFDQLDDALSWVEKALGPDHHMKTTWSGNCAAEWFIESRNGHANDGLTIGGGQYAATSIFRKKRVEIRSNNFAVRLADRETTTDIP